MKIKGTPQFFLELRCTKPSLLVFCLPRVGDKLFNIRLLSVFPCFRKPIPALTPAYAFSSCGVSFPVLELFLLKTAIRSALPVLISSFANRVLLVHNSATSLLLCCPACLGFRQANTGNTGLRFFCSCGVSFRNSYVAFVVFRPQFADLSSPNSDYTPAYAFSACQIKDLFTHFAYASFVTAVLLCSCPVRLALASRFRHSHRLTLLAPVKSKISTSLLLCCPACLGFRQANTGNTGLRFL